MLIHTINTQSQRNGEHGCYKSCFMHITVVRLDKYSKFCPNIFMQHVWTVNYQTTHNYERKAIEIDERVTFKVTLFTHYHFSLMKIHRNGNEFHTEIYTGKLLKSFLHIISRIVF